MIRRRREVLRRGLFMIRRREVLPRGLFMIRRREVLPRGLLEDVDLNLEKTCEKDFVEAFMYGTLQLFRTDRE